MPLEEIKKTSSSGARLAIRLLQDAAQNGEIDPWDIDVIPVIDGFLDQLRHRIEFPNREHSGSGGTFERDLAESSEAFLAASVLVGLKAEVLEADIFPIEDDLEDDFELSFAEQGWLDPRLNFPRHPERHLYRLSLIHI